MLSASGGAMLQGAESGDGGGAQAAAASSILGEIGDEDSKGRAGGEFSGDGDGDRGFPGGGSGGNRWPRQETLALLKIRSDMDVVFRDSSLKGPLWEEVSRKMADLGYNRSAKKCKEKFENVYKYHKRTKEGRAAKSDGKTYRFFDQLQALESHSMHPHLPPPPPPQAAVPISMAMPPPIQPPTIPAHVTVTSTNQPPLVVSHSTVGQQSQPSVQPGIPAPIQQVSMSVQNANAIAFPSSPSETPSSSETSATSSDEEIHGMRRKRKRKWKGFFERLMKRVIGKQEDLQQRFLEAIEKREHDRTVREEAWKAQEMARLNREHEILVQERSMAAAKDAALISFLQKLSNQQQIQIPIPPPVIQPPIIPPQPQPRTPTQTPTPIQAPVQLPQTQEPKSTNATAIVQVSGHQQQLVVSASPAPARTNNGDPSGGYLPGASSSRWPKTEVEALINLRTILDQKYQETGPKGPLWEEISSEMKKLGYNRNAKRCKEKWENINKYFKKVKESNKKRPEDSKTCPYFHQLDALYRQKTSKAAPDSGFGGYSSAKSHQPAAVAPVEAMAAPIMAQPEQQWPVQRDPMDQDRDEDDDEEEEEEDEDDQGDGYEIVANTNNGSSMGGASAAAAASS